MKTVKEVADAIVKSKVTSIPRTTQRCDTCGTPPSYTIEHGEDGEFFVYFDTSCNCKWSTVKKSSIEEITEFMNGFPDNRAGRKLVSSLLKSREVHFNKNALHQYKVMGPEIGSVGALEEAVTSFINKHYPHNTLVPKMVTIPFNHITRIPEGVKRNGTHLNVFFYMGKSENILHIDKYVSAR